MEKFVDKFELLESVFELIQDYAHVHLQEEGRWTTSIKAEILSDIEESLEQLYNLGKGQQ